jgi:hypothetical protein
VLEGKNQEAGNQADLAQGKANEAIDAAKKAKLLLINATSDLETAEQRQADRLQALEAARASLRAVRAGTSSCPSSPQKDPRTASTTCPDCPPATEGCESPSGCPQRPNQPADQNTDSSCEGDGCKALPVIECRGGSMTGAIDCVGQKISPGR